MSEVLTEIETNLNLAIKAVEFGMPALASEVNKTIVDVYQAYKNSVSLTAENEQLKAQLAELQKPVEKKLAKKEN